MKTNISNTAVISDRAFELAEMARAAGQHTLGFILDMAVLEAHRCIEAKQDATTLKSRGAAAAGPAAAPLKARCSTS
jgi:Mrp family chromosome partitioning ATPase